MACRRYVISGRVQGVLFRASTARQARNLGLSGHAVNLANGCVDVLACGADGALDKLESWLWKGPKAAKVTGVTRQEVDCTAPESFTTG